MTTTTDLTALLEAIKRNRDDDTLRGVYADALDEAGDERVPCPHNGKCPIHCDGVSFLDTSRRLRAELIRVQCELAKDPKNKYGCRKCTSPAVVKPSFSEEECCCRYKPLYHRERELLAKHPSRFRVRCCVCGGGSVGYQKDSVYLCRTCNNTGYIGTPVRGFLTSVTVPSIAAVLEWRPPPYGATAGGVRIPGRWVPTDYAEKHLLAPYCDGTHPLLCGVEVADRVPWGGPNNNWNWTKTRPHHNDLIAEQEEILSQIWELLNDHLPIDDSGWKRYSSLELARRALSEAVWKVLLELGEKK